MQEVLKTFRDFFISGAVEKFSHFSTGRFFKLPYSNLPSLLSVSNFA